MPFEAYDPVEKGKSPRRIYYGTRRAKVADMLAEGHSVRSIASEIGVSKSTVERDKQWLESSEHFTRAQDIAREIIEGEIIETGLMLPEGNVPYDVEEYKQIERMNVIALVAKKKTYRQVADALNISISTVQRHVNAYLAEYGDWGGRTMVEWRNEQLIDIDEKMSELDADMNIQPIPREGTEAKWDLTPLQAANIRRSARALYADLQKQKSKLLGLLVNKTEVDVESKVMVVQVKGVDLSQLR